MPPGAFPWQPGGRLASQSGGQPLPLPQATTLPATLITATGASLNGSVNPQGLSGTWWFAYGTSPTYGSTTSPQAVSGSLPVTVNATLTGLTTGTMYHVAVVVQTAGGKVYGVDQTFTAAAPAQVTNASQPLNPVGGQPVSVPHFAWPFTMTAGGAQVVEQDSLAEIFGCVQAIANTPLGAIPEVPSLGMPQLAFGLGPLDTLPAVSALQAQEPRASQQALASALDAAGSQWQLSLTTQTVGAGEN